MLLNEPGVASMKGYHEFGRTSKPEVGLTCPFQYGVVPSPMKNPMAIPRKVKLVI
jgi:hypothetical protein